MDNATDWWARIIAVLSLLLTAGIFLYDHFRGPDLRASSAKYVYMQGWPRLGIAVSFYNDGGRVAIVNSGTLTLDDGSNKLLFRLTLFSPSTDKWTADSGNVTVIPATLSLFSQIVVKPADIADGVFWYSPDFADFKFLPDKKYKACLNFSQPGVTQQQNQNEPCDAVAVFHLDNDIAAKAVQHREIVHPIRTDE